MLKLILDKILENKFWVIGVFAIVSAWGIMSVITLPIDAVPDITNVQVMINTKTGALDPEQIEKTVTYPIETEMSGLPNLEDIRSLSKYGLSQVILIFKEGTDLYFVRQQVAQRLQNIAENLPSGTTPELAPITTGLGEVVMYTVKAKEGSALAKTAEKQRLLYLRTIQDFIIRPELKKTLGVAEVDSTGGFRKEIHINGLIDEMEKYGISFEDLNKQLQTLGDSYGGGYIQREGQQIIVRSSSAAASLEKIGMIPVKIDVRGKSILLKDVANVREDHTQRLGGATSNGQEAVLGTALMYIGANSREVSIDVAEALKQIKLPSDVETTVVYTRSFLVNQTIKTVSKSLVEGAILVIAVLLLLLGNLRAAVLVALAIPISMLFAITGMKFFGISANLMSLGAIDFGLLVDGSVVMIENLLRRFQEEKDAAALSIPQRLELVRDSALEVAKPVILGLFIIMVVYVPILGLEGIEGKMFHPMAMTVLMALGASLLVAFFLMPVLGFILIKPPKGGAGHHDPVVFRVISRLYQPVLEFGIRKRKIVVIATIAMALLSGFILTRMGSDFIPQLEEGDLVQGIVRPTDVSLDKSILEQQKAEQIIKSFSEVDVVFSRLGTPESATDPMGVNFADTFIILKKDHSSWPEAKQEDGSTRIRTKDELATAIAEAIQKEFPGTEISSTQPIEMRFNEILEGSRADVSLRIFGSDLAKLIEYIDASKDVVEKIAGVSEAEMDALTALRKSPMMNIDLNYDELSRYGVTLQEANSALETAMGGIQVGNFYEADRRFPIILHMDEALREQPEAVRKIPVALAEGGTIPLSKVATFTEAEQVTTIARSFGKRYAALSIFLKNRDVGGFVDEAKAKIGSQLKLDQDYTVEWGGQFKNLERARTRLLLIIPITLLVIFFILLRNFESMKLTLLVYSSIPIAVTGGVFALFLRGIPLSISAGIGFIALLGIAILNSMVLVDFINQLRAKGVSVAEAVTQGAMLRLRPVAMTALVAGLGFLPMALNTGLGAEVQRPLATVVIGGLITSTLLTLVLLPTLYIWLEEKKS